MTMGMTMHGMCVELRRQLPVSLLPFTLFLFAGEDLLLFTGSFWEILVSASLLAIGTLGLQKPATASCFYMKHGDLNSGTQNCTDKCCIH